MDVTVDREAFEAALGTALTAAARRPLVPVLGAAYVSVRDGRLAVRGTDAETTIEACGPRVEAGDGDVAVEGAKLHELVKRLSGETVRLRLVDDGARCEVRSGRSRSVLAVVAEYHDQAPPMPAVADALWSGAVVAGEFAEAWASVAFAAASAERAWHGVLCEPKGGGVTLVATDGHRLSMATVPCGGLAGGDAVVVPSGVGAALLAALAPHGDDGGIELRADRDVLSLAGGEARFVTRLMENRFPDWRAVVPTGDAMAMATFDRDEFLAATRRAAVFAPDEKSPLCIAFDAGALRVASQGASGEGEEDVPAALVGACPGAAVNAKYVMDAVRALPAGKVVLAWTDGKPLVFSHEGGDAYRRRHVVAGCAPRG